MKLVTLRNIPPELARIIRRKAQEKQMSINKTVLSILEESLGLRGKKPPRRRYHDLDHLAGTWTEEQAADFHKALAEQRVIDEELWK